jgi:hypothetical protein
MSSARRRVVTRRGQRTRLVTLEVVITAAPTAEFADTIEAARAIAPLFGADVPSGDGDGVVSRVLALARIHLGLDISWFSRFTGDVHTLEAVSGDTERFRIAQGSTNPAFASYCSRVVAGELPNVIPDALADERTRDLPLRSSWEIGRASCRERVSVTV